MGASEQVVSELGFDRRAGVFGAKGRGRPSRQEMCRNVRREPAWAGRDPEEFGVAETRGGLGMVAQQGGT